MEILMWEMLTGHGTEGFHVSGIDRGGAVRCSNIRVSQKLESMHLLIDLSSTQKTNPSSRCHTWLPR